MKKIINLTPHTLTVRNTDGEDVSFKSSGLARVQMTEEAGSSIKTPEGVFQLTTSKYGEVEGLPPPQKDTIFVVSFPVRSALGDSRPDCVGPNTGSTAIRDPEGRILAVLSFLK